MVGPDRHLPLFKIRSGCARGWRVRTSGIGPDGAPFEAHGEYLEVTPPNRLVHSWIASWTGKVKTTVHWELETKDQGTLLRIRHCGLAAHPELAQSYRGWPRMLGWIQALLEKGETADTRAPFSAASD